MCAAMKNLKKLNLNSTRLSALTFEGLKVSDFMILCLYWYCIGRPIYSILSRSADPLLPAAILDLVVPE